MSDNRKNNTFFDNNLKLKTNNIDKKERIDFDVIENFCHFLKYNKCFKGVLDISYTTLTEINLLNNMGGEHENKNILGSDIKITLNKNITSLKLPHLNIENFQFLIHNLKENNSINKLYFFISYNNQGYKNCIVQDENVINNYEDYINNVKDLFKELLTVIEKKTNIQCVKCDADCNDKELNEIISFINSTCKKHKNNLEKVQVINDNKIQINSFEKMKLLISDINGKGKHIEKFEREEKIVLDHDVITFLEKMLQ
ncbi:hypothetical protein PFDG_01190 [Plasmodium falciparum Dd2]|uniref:Uncharacterized protein n=1 Tax=Plasmodium falciparum (isolate Dd2) TaxID=57267 RepID=A0A0L7LYD6_PLAF4|nr:hypothetical protein PFDG_01190 [Plasmodium falciparum Dd2]